ncbi:class I SAM-dependent methyltransferase [Natronosalvus rutilus]|nr:class I SAM-dependent methyltransferase [Natronosalvus rutilus]
MTRLSAAVGWVRATIDRQRETLANEGALTYLRTRPQAVLGAFGTLLLSMDSRRMDSDEVQKRWAERSGVYSPEFYADMGTTGGTESIRSVLDARVERDATILEVGCSAGRHLEHLREHGYENLHGIDLNEDASDVMAERYPELAEDGTFYWEPLEDVLPRLEDGQFDVVFSVEALQHIHPDNEWVFGEIARVTDDLLVTKENEPDGDQLLRTTQVEDFPLYFRQWKPIFTDLGFTQLARTEDSVDTLRVFYRKSEPAAETGVDVGELEEAL